MYSLDCLLRRYQKQVRSVSEEAWVACRSGNQGFLKSGQVRVREREIVDFGVEIVTSVVFRFY